MGIIKQIGENVMPLTILYVVFKVIEPAMNNADGYFLYHAYWQIVHFIIVAHIPCLLTGVMWWVDLAWPFGLVLISIYNYMYAFTPKERISYKAEMITFCYFF